MDSAKAMEEALCQSVVDAAVEHLGWTCTAAARLPIVGRPGYVVVFGEEKAVQRLVTALAPIEDTRMRQALQHAAQHDSAVLIPPEWAARLLALI